MSRTCRHNSESVQARLGNFLAMGSCCDPRGCDDFFGGTSRAGSRERYRKRGLDKTSSRIVGFLEAEGIERASVLEIGGGVGEIQLELLKRGAASAVNLELSPAYDAEARALLREAGIDERRVERRLHDIADAPEAVEAADVVVLHRVVCCYPDYERLLGAAGSRARRALVFSHPPRNARRRARSSRCRTCAAAARASSSARSPTRPRRCSTSAARTASAGVRARAA